MILFISIYKIYKGYIFIYLLIPLFICYTHCFSLVFRCFFPLRKTIVHLCEGPTGGTPPGQPGGYKSEVQF